MVTFDDDETNAVAAFHKNTVTGATTGLQVVDYLPPPPPPVVQSEKSSKQLIRGAKARGESGTSWGAGVPQLTANYNRILSSSTAIENSGGTASVEFNWWGCNEGPNNAGCGFLLGSGTSDFTPWVILSASATPNSIIPGATSNVSSDLSSDNTNTPLADFIPNTPVGYTATNGTMSDANRVSPKHRR